MPNNGKSYVFHKTLNDFQLSVKISYRTYTDVMSVYNAPQYQGFERSANLYHRMGRSEQTVTGLTFFLIFRKRLLRNQNECKSLIWLKMRVFSRKFQNSYRRKIVNTKYIFTKSSLEDAQSTPLSENMSSITARYEFFDKSIGGAPLLPFWNRQDFCCRSYRKMLFFVEITGVGQNGAVFFWDGMRPEDARNWKSKSSCIECSVKHLPWTLRADSNAFWKLSIFMEKSILHFGLKITKYHSNIFFYREKSRFSRMPWNRF